MGKELLHMSILSAVILGVIQGVAEFLPISSSGHLAIAQNLLGLKIEGSTDGTFDVLLHLGTLIAVFVAYWPDIVDMIREFFLGVKDIARGTTPTPVPPNRRMILLLIIGTLPLFVIVPFKDYIEGLSANTIVVGCALLITGVLLFFSDRYNRGKKNAGSVPLRDVLVIGVAQAFATIPGLSRSGTTVSVGCFLGLDRRFALRYSFLMSIPAVLGANILNLKDIVDTGVDMTLLPAYISGVVTAAVLGYLSIRLLKFVTEKGKFGAFSYYCWAVGALTIIASILL